MPAHERSRPAMPDPADAHCRLDAAPARGAGLTVEAGCKAKSTVKGDVDLQRSFTSLVGTLRARMEPGCVDMIIQTVSRGLSQPFVSSARMIATK